MDREIEKVKQEHEEKMRKKAKSKDKKKDEKDNKKGEKKDDDAKKDEKERDDKIKSIQAAGAEAKSEDDTRIFALHKNFYQMRISRIRNMEIARRNRERLKDPSLFTSAPRTDL